MRVGLTRQQEQVQDWPDLPEHPGRPPDANASIGELLAWQAMSQRRLEIWSALLYAQQEQIAAAAQMQKKQRLGVTVKDIEVPFWSMVSILVTTAVAAIPAAIILFLLGAFLTFLMTLAGASLFG